MGESKKMKFLAELTITKVVKEVNEREIKRDDIVSLVKSDSQYILIYYG